MKLANPLYFIWTLLCFFALSFSTFIQAGSNAELEALTGHDSNPYRLSSAYDTAFYSDVSLKGSVSQGSLTAGKFKAAAGVSQLYYGSGGQHGEKTKFKFEGKFSKKNIIIFADRYDSSLVYKLADSTYVERSTGLPADYSGFNTENRYDAETRMLKNRYRVSAFDAVELGLEVNYKAKDYEDYNEIGLYSLDYQQVTLLPGVELSVGEKQDVEFGFVVRQRYYDSRLAKDAFGSAIDDRELGYAYRGFSLAYEFEYNELLTLNASYKNTKRSDNGGGYYDQRKEGLKLFIELRPDSRQILEAGIIKSDTDFDKSPLALDLDEENRETEGYRYVVDYRYRLSEQRRQPMYVVTSVLVDDYEDSDPVYTYDRVRLLLGVSKEF